MGEINPYRLKISQLRALVAIADLGTFSDAALQLDLSQSAVSHAIATLEEELGVILLSRGRQGAVLTPVGEQITAKSREILHSLTDLCKLAQQTRGLQSGQVRVAGFRSVATHLLPAVIDRFQQQYPQLSVAIDEHHHYHDVEEAVRQGRADVGFTYLPTAPEFKSWELLRDRYLALLPPIALGTESPIDWQTLTQYPLILSPTDDGDRQTLTRYLADYGVTLRPAYEVREDSTVISMVRRGLGAAIMARLAAEPIPADVVTVEFAEKLERVIGVILLSEALQPPAVYAFLETLKSVWLSE
ncbi:MAG: LysR family transcriptional regulator [Leptolyngbyaceae cyanobacterium SL_1_1]|nr:LysR family transcriptional regulator [Leptolyngbyaceae cyanobacterium RM1_1_2]NJO12036.1 LysR family transcriptional regulator [Leptolyngbyaceae cyanobacterium SL_1_1]